MLRRGLSQLTNALKWLFGTVFALLLGRPRPYAVDAGSYQRQKLNRGPHQQHLEVLHRVLIQGVYCLYEPGGDTKPEFDVVFIHGLRLGSGDEQWLTTWTTRDGNQCWPQAWLSQCFPGARVLALSYDSSVKRSSGDPMKLWESAINSVNALASVGLGDRPYFFVGHSLGGLLVKEVLLRANQHAHREEKPGLKDNCKGIVFYGVPHLDAKITDMDTLLSTAFWGRGNEIKKGLKELGQNCYRRNIDFGGLQESYPAYNFIETDMTDGVMVVRKEVAGFNTKATNMTLVEDADHFEVCKPSNATDFIFANFVIFLKSRLAEECIKFQCEELVILT